MLVALVVQVVVVLLQLKLELLKPHLPLQEEEVEAVAAEEE